MTELTERAERGACTLITGCMYAGKTTALIDELSSLVGTAGFRPLAISSRLDDTRWTSVSSSGVEKVEARGSFRSHGGKTYPAVAATALLSVIETDVYRAATHVYVDEGQFFDALAEFVERAIDAGKHVTVGALNGDYAQRPFPAVSALLPHCTEVRVMFGTCMDCGTNPSAYSVLRCPSDDAPREGEFLVAGADKYAAVCGACLRREKARPRG